MSNLQFSEGCVTVLSNGQKNPGEVELGEDALKALALNSIQVRRVATRGDNLLVDVDIQNVVKGPINYSIKILSPAVDSTTSGLLRGEHYVYDVVLVADGEKRSFELSDYFPSESMPELFWLETRVELFGYWASVTRTFFVGANGDLSCKSAAT